MPKKIRIVGAPFTFGQPKLGVERGPKVMRDAGLLQLLGNVEDFGDVSAEISPCDHGQESQMTNGSHGNTKNMPEVGEVCRRLHEAVYKQLSDDSFVVVLGGDHSLAMGSISAVLRKHPETVVIWVDAHADINTPATSSSGNVHGMPVSFLMGLADPAEFASLRWLTSRLPTNHIAYFGSRDVDEPERKILQTHNIPSYDMPSIRSRGILDVLKEGLHKIDPDSCRPIHLSFDIDGVDPEFAPSTGTPVPNGLTMEEALALTKFLADTGRLVSMDLAEVNPALVPDGAVKTARAAVDVIASAAGRK
jgi:arginase